MKKKLTSLESETKPLSENEQNYLFFVFFKYINFEIFFTSLRYSNFKSNLSFVQYLNYDKKYTDDITLGRSKV